MGLLYVVLALFIQSSLTFANEDAEVTSREVLTPIEDPCVPAASEVKTEWMDMFLLPQNHLFPGGLGSNAAIMASATKSNKTAEEQLHDIKELAREITNAIQCEMANLLTYALIDSNKNKDKETETDENKLRKRRSVESPMDSTKMVMRLLKHIKANNEYQNIAIENMMTAQEIADKYGIEFTPDADMLSDLAVAANEQTKELSEILQEACDTKNVTEQVKFVPVDKESCEENSAENSTYYVYSIHPQETPAEVLQGYYPPQEFQPQPIHNHHHHQPGYVHVNQYNPYETQIMPPPVHQAPVTPKPNFYDTVGYSPEYYQPYCPVEPFTTTTTIILPEELFEPEPELVGEEYEETVSSKVFVDHESEPGISTVNHVMTYTLSEKSLFRKPELESLPQQIQYSFFLM